MLWIIMDLTTPALLFPAISLLLLAYTNRFQTLGLLMRQMHKQQSEGSKIMAKHQLTVLKNALDTLNRCKLMA